MLNTRESRFEYEHLCEDSNEPNDICLQASSVIV